MHILVTIIGLEAYQSGHLPALGGGRPEEEEWREREIEGRRPASSRWNSARGRGRSGSVEEGADEEVPLGQSSSRSSA
jgi:hypothetical protein